MPAITLSVSAAPSHNFSKPDLAARQMGENILTAGIDLLALPVGALGVNVRMMA